MRSISSRMISCTRFLTRPAERQPGPHGRRPTCLTMPARTEQLVGSRPPAVAGGVPQRREEVPSSPRTRQRFLSGAGMCSGPAERERARALLGRLAERRMRGRASRRGVSSVALGPRSPRHPPSISFGPPACRRRPCRAARRSAASPMTLTKPVRVAVHRRRRRDRPRTAWSRRPPDRRCASRGPAPRTAPTEAISSGSV